MSVSYRSRRRSLWCVAGSALGGTALLAACGSAGSGSTPAGATSPSASASPTAGISCTSITSLRKSLTNLGQLQVNQQTAAQIAADIGSVEAQLTALTGQAHGAYATQSAQLTTEVRHVTGDAQELVAHPTAANLSAVQTAVTALQASSRALIAELKAACPGS
jgi:hypothetical protein